MMIELKDPGLLNQAALVDGEWIAPDAQAIEVINPADATRVGRVPACGASETRAAIAAANAGLIDRGDRIIAQGIIQLFQGQGRATRQPNTGVIAGANRFIYAKARGFHPTPLFDRRLCQGLFAPLLVHHAF